MFDYLIVLVKDEQERKDFIFNDLQRVSILSNLGIERMSMLLNKVIESDCLEFIRDLPNNSIDIIITDPPYAISSGNKLAMKNIEKKPGFGGDWSVINEDWDRYSLEEYLHLIKNVLNESYRVLKQNGSMFICGTYHNIGIMNYHALLSGFNIVNEIIWFKRNAFPNLSQKCLTASHENILWLSKSKEWNFNYDEMKVAEFPFDQLKEKNKQLRSVWDIPNNKQKKELSYKQFFPKSHWIKSQKPLRLIDRCIELASKESDIIADWFCGSGTTLLSALNHNLAYIGCEKNPKYIEVIKWRLEHKC